MCDQVCVCVCVWVISVTFLQVFLGKLIDVSETLSNFNQYLTTAVTARRRAPTVLGRTMAQKKRFGEGATEPREPQHLLSETKNSELEAFHQM